MRERRANLIAFAEHVTAFGVAQNDEIGAIVLDHGRADVARECALLHLVAVLRGHVNAFVEFGANEIDVESRRRDENLFS